ncbi:Uu.00g000030.m01.CDS01 [Anthostomella pinea]|uniref:Uu.00g000030.m01.CDS01 n=1 Tax=Anthostomella pinea TaxID=933095 RepID=A0AAI8VJ19_9PEZI|nr:Uu.00g000030.m01.CDS01 [Anthostomella pinea]
MTLIQQLGRIIQAPAAAKRYTDAGVAILFVVVNQFLVMPMQILLDRHSINLPASIVVMLLASILMVIASSISGAVGQFYDKHIRGPSDFLGRHMSLGFVAFFIMLNRDHITNSADVPKIAGAFVITTIMSYVSSFLLAAGGFKLETSLRGLRTRSATDIESNNRQSWPQPTPEWPAPSTQKRPKLISEISQLSTINELSTNASFLSANPSAEDSSAQSIESNIKQSWPQRPKLISRISQLSTLSELSTDASATESLQSNNTQSWPPRPKLLSSLSMVSIKAPLLSTNAATEGFSPHRPMRPKLVSHISTLSTLSTHSSLFSIRPESEGSSERIIDFFVHTVPIWISLSLLLVVGVPVYLATGYEMPFEAFTFAVLWAVTTQFQRWLRLNYWLLCHPRVRSPLVIFSNPLLLTWALGSAYLWTKTATTGRSIEDLVSSFRHYSSLAESLAHIVADRKSSSSATTTFTDTVAANLGAGDLAGPLLDAGIVCLGLKMYEYRHELWAAFGTVFATCTALAALNVFANPAVARLCGLQADEATAFAGRSVTLALGVPAIENLGGSTTLMSAVAIFSGMLFAMTGDWLFTLVRVNDRRAVGNQEKVTEPMFVSDDEAATAAAPADVVGRDAEKGCPIVTVTNTEKNCVTVTATEGEPGGRIRKNATCTEESGVVASGVTVGINAAAMGTAFLIERDSRATAYSALSMTVFGAMTVALTALPGARETIVSLTTR